MSDDENRRDELLTRKEAAAYLGVSVGTLEVWACTKQYDLPYIKVGRLVKYTLADLNAFIDRRKIHPCKK